jgi:hypothetical protein
VFSGEVGTNLIEKSANKIEPDHAMKFHEMPVLQQKRKKKLNTSNRPTVHVSISISISYRTRSHKAPWLYNNGNRPTPKQK